MVLVASDHRMTFDSIRSTFEPDFDVLTMFPHPESVIAAAGALDPFVIVVDLSRRSTNSAAMMTRLLEEIPLIPLVVLLDREANPDASGREWAERGVGGGSLASALTPALELALGGRIRAVVVDSGAPENAPPPTLFAETAYSLTFNC
jgi:hypothetical protein